MSEEELAMVVVEKLEGKGSRATGLVAVETKSGAAFKNALLAAWG
jgi:hypothetical protein